MACEIKTVKDLRLFLNEFEKSWTKDDEALMGRFEDTPLLVWYEEGYDDQIKNGYGPAYIEYDITGLGLIIDMPEEVDE